MQKQLLLLAILISTIAYSQTPITDANIQAAINTCLSTNPVDGMCISSEYGAMPDWDVSEVTDMGYLFRDKNDFNTDLSNWDVKNVTDMRSMFENTFEFNADLSEWDVSRVVDMARMFSRAFAFDADLSNWDVGSVVDMYGMFVYANTFSADISNWDVRNVTSMKSMFYGVGIFNANLSAWNVGNVTDMTFMFAYTSIFNADISNWDVRNTTDMLAMFQGATAFNLDLSDWDVRDVEIMNNMFNNSGLSTDNYDAILNGWSQQDVNADITLGAEGINYCIGEDARQSLIVNYGWIINDSGLDCETVTVTDQNQLDLYIYPNPSSNVLHVEGNKNELKVIVYDMLGKEVNRQYITDNLDLTDLEKGIYLINFSDGLTVSTYKIIKN